MKYRFLPVLLVALALCACLPDKISSYTVKHTASDSASSIEISFQYVDTGMCAIITPYSASKPDVKKLYDDCKERWASDIVDMCEIVLSDGRGMKIDFSEGGCEPEVVDDYANKKAVCTFKLKDTLEAGDVVVLGSKCESDGAKNVFTSPKLIVPEAIDVCEDDPDAEGCEQIESEEEGQDELPIVGDGNTPISTVCQDDPQADGCDADEDGVVGEADLCPGQSELYDSDGETPLDGTLDGCDATRGTPSSTRQNGTPTFMSGEKGGSCTLTASATAGNDIAQLVLLAMALYGLATARFGRK